MNELVNNKKETPSSYQPSQDVIDMTKIVRDDYDQGVRILWEPWVELNDRSVIDDENRGQMMMNAFVDENVEDPHEAWKWRGTRSMARNKGLAMHANLTAGYLLPLFTAQNEEDEIDRDFSEVMRDIIEWMALPTNSNYQETFLQVVLGMLSNPVTYMECEFNEVYQTIKRRHEDGSITKEEMMDEILSGFKANVLSSSQVLITNAYQRNIQRQRAIIKRKYAEKAELEAKYGDHPNWKYVRKGIKSIYSEEDGLFYDIRDEDHPNLTTEEIWYNRMEDLEIPFVGGIYMGDANVDDNPIKHRDNRGAPKYNVVPFGYARIGEHFFYYKSLMNAVGWDNQMYDAMSEIVMNRSLLDVNMPVAVHGTDKVDSEIIFPSAVVAFEDKDTKITPLLPQSNLASGYNALQATEKSMEESSVNATMSGQLPEASQTAYSVSQAQAQAKKLIGGVGKLLAESVVQVGDLMKDIAINNITIPEVEELVGGGMKLKYRSFLLDNKAINGNMMSRSIKFDSSLIGMEMTDTEKMTQEMRMLDEHGDKESILQVNPYLFARFKYLTRVDTEEMFTKNQEYWQPVLMSLKAQLAQDPYVNQEALTRKLMYSFFNSDGDDLMQEAPEQVGAPAPQTPQTPQTAMAGQAQNQMTSNALRDAV